MYSLESVYIDSHEPEESIRSLWSAGYTEAESGDGLRYLSGSLTATSVPLTRGWRHDAAFAAGSWGRLVLSFVPISVVQCTTLAVAVLPINLRFVLQASMSVTRGLRKPAKISLLPGLLIVDDGDP